MPRADTACGHQSSFTLNPRTSSFLAFFFFNDTATTEIYTLSLHDALPISFRTPRHRAPARLGFLVSRARGHLGGAVYRSEEHTSELQSQSNLVCRLLLEKKKIQSTELTRDYSKTGVTSTMLQFS